MWLSVIDRAFYCRYYLYGIQGFTDEIIFTALFDFFALDSGWTLRGHSALSTFFIYGTCSFMVERLYVFLYYKHGVQWQVFLSFYTLIAALDAICLRGSSSGLTAFISAVVASLRE